MKIVIKNAREHNLKNVSLELPKNKLIVVTGLSGSGKSSLAVDTIWREGQRRYLESLSSYARQFIGKLDKADVDEISGLTPSILVEQRKVNANPRSTVGTVTEIYDYFRLLYSRAGQFFCPKCDCLLVSATIQEIKEEIFKKFKGKKIYVLAPIIEGQKGTLKNYVEKYEREGFLRVRFDGEIYRIEDFYELKVNKNVRHNLEIVVDRFTVDEENLTRIWHAIETASNLTSGIIKLLDLEGKEYYYSLHLTCPKCKKSYEKPEPRHFSFNSPYGACSYCDGLGEVYRVEERDVEFLIHPDFWPIGRKLRAYLRKRFKTSDYIEALACFGKNVEELVWLGDREYNWPGLEKVLVDYYFNTNKKYAKEVLAPMIKEGVCPKCKGSRLNEFSSAVRFAGKKIQELMNMEVTELLNFLKSVELDEYDKKLVGKVLEELIKQIGFLNDVGVGYLTLSRKLATLSGGEAQRVRLASHLGSRLSGITYVLDEPTIGLHVSDTKKLIGVLKQLRDLGNTLIVVEHDDEVIRNADWIVEIGPKAGSEGGEIVFNGPIDEFLKANTLTSNALKQHFNYLDDRLDYKLSEKVEFIELKGCKKNNLKNIDVKFLYKGINIVLGVSGAGKSSLVTETFLEAFDSVKVHGKDKIEFLGNLDDIKKVLKKEDEYLYKLKYFFYKNREFYFSKMITPIGLQGIRVIDQSPIGRTSRSNPATYIKVFDSIRNLFASLPESQVRGYTKSRFSFNLSEGRCQNCNGEGYLKIDMQFMPDVYIKCPVCKGKRFNEATLEIKLNGKTIADVLEMTVDEALKFFEQIYYIKNKLQLLHDVGLGYMKLGQPSPTLSGGEAQRIKLTKFLHMKNLEGEIFVLDEPTIGLHWEDIEKLMKVLKKLAQAGATIIIIEHNLQLLKIADWVIELGLTGGQGGGKLIFEGPINEFLKSDTITSIYAKSMLTKS